MLLKIVHLNRRNKSKGTIRLHLEFISKQLQIYLICDLQNLRRYTFVRVSVLSLSHHLLYHTANRTVAFICVSRRCAYTYFHTLILTYVCHYYAANLVQRTKLHISQQMYTIFFISPTSVQILQLYGVRRDRQTLQHNETKTILLFLLLIFSGLLRRICYSHTLFLS